MPASIFNGSAVKILKDMLRFKNGGEIYWDYTNDCPSYNTSISGVSNQIGQEVYVRVINNTGSLIPNGTPVYISGADIANELPEITPAIATTYDESRSVGIATTSIADGDIGFVTRFGVIHDIDTSSYSAGDSLYLSDTSAGEFTSTRPVDGNFAVKVATVLKSDALTGEILAVPNPSEFTTETVQKTGWSSYGLPSLAFTDGTRTLDLTPASGSTFHWYQMGVKYSKTSDSIVIPNTEGLYLIYYNMDTLTYILSPNDGQIDSVSRNNTTVAYIYWNAAGATHLYLGKEFHDMQMPPLTKTYLHFAFGTRYISGLALNGLVVDGVGSLASEAQFGVDAGAIADEDLYHPALTIASTVGLPIFYLSGTSASPTLRTLTNAGYSITTTGTGRMAYNFLTGGNWTIAEVTNNSFALCHVFCINEYTQSKRLIAFMGQAVYGNVTAARAGAQTEIVSLQTYGILPREMKSIATVVFQTSDTYTNAVKSRTRSISADENYVDWRVVNTAGGSVGGGAVTSSFADSAFQVYNSVDVTKVMQLDASNITTATTRIFTIPNRSMILNVSSGIKLEWSNDGLVACGEETGSASFYKHAYTFAYASAQELHTAIKVPNDYVAGKQIRLMIKVFCPTAGSATVLLQSVATLIRSGTDALSSATNQRTSTNSAQAIATANLEYIAYLDLTDSVGAINSVGVSPNDTILVKLQRGTDTNTDLAYFIDSTTEVLI